LGGAFDGVGVDLPVVGCIGTQGFGDESGDIQRGGDLGQGIGVRAEVAPTVLGDLFTESLRHMAHSKVLAEFKQARPALCRGCGLEETCLGGCKAAAQVCYGSLTAPEPFLELNRSRITRITP